MTAKRIFALPSRQLAWGQPSHLASDWPGYGLMWEELPSAPCTLPTLPDWRIRFPEFKDISDERVTLAIGDASCWADSTWISNGCPNCTLAIAYLAAHFLALQLMAAAMLPDVLPADEGEEGGQVIAGGSVTSIRFESMGVSFSSPQAGSSGGQGSGTGVGDRFDMGSTPYGQFYLQLLKVNQPAVVVV